MCAARLTALVLLAALVACASVRVQVDFDPEEDFSRLRAFAWLRDAPEPTGDHRIDNPLLDARIRAAVERELVAKGFARREGAAPDFYVTYHLSIEAKLDVRTVNRVYRDRRWDVSVPETRVRQYDQGTLVLDVADAVDEELVWRGAGTTRLRERPTPEQTTREVDAAVAAILKHFPPED